MDADVLDMSGTAPVDLRSLEPPLAPSDAAVEMRADRPRRRWTEDAPAPAELRAALAGRRASEDAVPSSPGPGEQPVAVAARTRRPDIPLGWGTVLHSLPTAEQTPAPLAQQQQQPATRPARWRLSAPPAPPATLELSPRHTPGAQVAK